MKATRKLTAMLGGALLTTGLLAAPSVEITAVQQQYPWTNTVDITYEVQGVTNMEYFVRFTPTTSDDKEILDVNGEPSIQVALTNNGTYVAQWYPQTNLQYTACKMTPAIFRGGSGGGDDYMIVDLDDWTVTYEPMATQEASNQRYNTDEYKTKKMVFRKIAAGDDYWIGEKNNTDKIGDAPNSWHQVKMPNDYYIGIFPVTGAQHSRLMKTTVSSSIAPAQGCSWQMVRGGALQLARPTTGPIANISKGTGLPFELPTISMLEVALRGGVTTKYLSGDTYDNLEAYGWTRDNSGGRLPDVGLKPANGYGIFDALNTHNWTIDRANSADLASLQTNGQQPITTGSTNIYDAPGIAANVDYKTHPLARCSARWHWGWTKNSSYCGYRLSLIVK